MQKNTDLSISVTIMEYPGTNHVFVSDKRFIYYDAAQEKLTEYTSRLGKAREILKEKNWDAMIWELPQLWQAAEGFRRLLPHDERWVEQERRCDYCNASLPTKDPRRRYCSKECKKKAAIDERRFDRQMALHAGSVVMMGRDGKITVVSANEQVQAGALRCQHCGESFEGRADAKYCSARCRVAANRKKKKESIGPASPAPSGPSA